VRYVAGYGAASDVPAPVVIGILLTLTHVYENRGEATAEVPAAARAFLSSEAWGSYA
jgi:hypothetical protein